MCSPMVSSKRLVLATLGCLLSGCGAGAPAPRAPEPTPPTPAPAAPPAPSSAAAAEAQASAQPDSHGIPSQCADADSDVCTPPKAFIEKLCRSTHLGVALVMFRHGTPFTRGYITRKTKAWNASGGASASDDYLVFDEEVLLLAKRAPPKGGMQVSGMGGYDALRWDGSCVTLAPEELTTKLPPKAKYPNIQWRLLDAAVQETLRSDAKIDKAYQTRRTECKGATMGTVSKACEKADAALATSVIEFVKAGGDVGKTELVD